MFSFERLSVYKKAQDQNLRIIKFLSSEKSIDPFMMDQLKRASLSIILNIAEGNGRERKGDRGYFLTVSRSSVFECVAILDVLRNLNKITEDNYSELYVYYEEISKMLIGLKKKISEFKSYS